MSERPVPLTVDLVCLATLALHPTADPAMCRAAALALAVRVLEQAADQRRSPYVEPQPRRAAAPPSIEPVPVWKPGEPLIPTVTRLPPKLPRHLKEPRHELPDGIPGVVNLHRYRAR